MNQGPHFTKLIDIPLGIGESPVWDHRTGLLWFIDMVAPAIYSYSIWSSQLQRYETPSMVCALGLAAKGRLVVALRDGVHVFDPESGKYESVAQPEPHLPDNRLNDGCVGPDGAFWVGSMFDGMPYQATGAFYRISADGGIRKIRDGIHIANGLGWSPDGRRLYYADSVITEIRCRGFDPETGETAGDEIFATLDGRLGHPDGAAVDASGCYWSAGVTAGRLNRISPEGQLLESIELPVSSPTMACFGGEDMKTLFITSLTSEPGSPAGEGTLISMKCEIAGTPAYIFGAGPI